ncbi:MBL fold metallo-hydrolase [Emergencia timonensis]|uniref:MBL fold metallo-hydrolase n=1 Tax=Emergencia timonensis TaxID=1776384 RepID=UPI003992ABAF
MMNFTFLSENKTDNPGCDAEHGLSIYIETDEMTILFDTGASNLFERNAERKHIDLTKPEALVISHGHYDHTEGVPRFCEINKTAPIYIHRDAFGECYGMEGDKIDKKPCSLKWSQDERKRIEDRFCLTEGPLWLTDNIVISGTIPDVPGNEPTEKFFEKKADGQMVPDPMNHEQFLGIRNGEKGIFLFSGCSHKGIVPVLEYSKQLFPGEKIAGIIAGMHLFSATDEMRKTVVGKVIAEHPTMVMPVHCTGIEAICMLKSELGDQCIVATAGNSYAY